MIASGPLSPAVAEIDKTCYQDLTVSDNKDGIKGLLPVQAHLKADKYYSVVANMRGTSPEDVATKIMSCEALRGLQVYPLPLSALKRSRDNRAWLYQLSRVCVVLSS